MQAHGHLYACIFSNSSILRLSYGDEKYKHEVKLCSIWGYGYDSQGRLASVTDNGSVIATYGYDANGNRTTVNGQTIAAYDEQDRLLSDGQNTYTYSANGELLTRTTP